MTKKESRLILRSKKILKIVAKYAAKLDEYKIPYRLEIANKTYLEEQINGNK